MTDVPVPVVLGVERLIAHARADGSPLSDVPDASGASSVAGASSLSRVSRVGVLSNEAAIVSDGRASWRALRDAGVPVVRLFGPEHGFGAVAQDAVNVGDGSVDGVEVVSLYGERSRPEVRHVADLDLVVVDLQDVGCRYYTYIYTLSKLVDTCREAGVPVVVCDRPNPIGADVWEGGALSRRAESEVGGLGLAHRHGMTIGEVALVANNRQPESAVIGGNRSEGSRRRRGPMREDDALTVWWMAGYRRSMHWRDTGLPWKQPSPNLPTPETALVYPGTCLFEGTELSEGRGTTRPFETIGAPWIDGVAVRDELAARDLPGVVFSASRFVPTFSTFSGTECGGVQLHVTDPATFRPLYTAVTMLVTIRGMGGAAALPWRALWEDEGRSFVDHLAGGPAFRTAVTSGAGVGEAYAILCRDASTFASAREAVLYYR